MVSSYPDFINNWKVNCRIGSGSSGTIFDVTSKDGQRAVAKYGQNEDVKNEMDVYQAVGQCPGFAAIYASLFVDNMFVIIMERLGSNLHSLLSEEDDVISVKETLNFAIQLVSRLKSLHATGYVHGDIHAGNIMLAEGHNLECGTVHLIDFGYSTRFQDEHGKKLQQKDVEFRTGVPRFNSINGHLKKSLSPRDDLESAAYVISFLFNEELPWDHIKETSEEDSCTNDTELSEPGSDGSGTSNSEIADMKNLLRVEEVMVGLPNCFIKFLHAVRLLEFQSDPDYDLYIALFKSAL